MAILERQELQVDLPALAVRVPREPLPPEWTALESGSVGSLRVQGTATMHLTPSTPDLTDPGNVQFQLTLVDAHYDVPLSASIQETRAIQELNASMLTKLAQRSNLKKLVDALRVMPDSPQA